MKLLSSMASCSVFALVLSSANGASSLVLDFESETNGDFFSTDVAGWSQDSSNPGAFGQFFPLAYISTSDFGAGASNSGHLGTQFANTPDNSTTTLTTAVDVSSLDVTSPQITLNLAILDNTADNFPGRDGFRIAFTGGLGQGIAEIALTPTAGDDDTWDVAFGVGGTAPTPTPIPIDALAGYVFEVDFNFSNTRLLIGPSQGATAPLVVGTRAAASLSGLANIEMTHEPIAAAGSSANVLVFDNITVTVPEPSSSLMFALGLGGFAARRRRA